MVRERRPRRYASGARLPTVCPRLKSLYAYSGLPKELYPAFRVAIDVARETPFDGGENDRERHRRRSLERILTQFEQIGAEDLDYLLAKLQEKAAA